MSVPNDVLLNSHKLLYSTVETVSFCQEVNNDYE